MMNTARALAALLLLLALPGCDASHGHVYPTDNVSGRWVGTGAFRSSGTYEANLLFRQSGEDVSIEGPIRFTDANGVVVDVPYTLRATLQGRTLTFPSGYGVATLSEDGRLLSWLFGDGSGSFELTRK